MEVLLKLSLTGPLQDGKAVLPNLWMVVEASKEKVLHEIIENLSSYLSDKMSRKKISKVFVDKRNLNFLFSPVIFVSLAIFG